MGRDTIKIKDADEYKACLESAFAHEAGLPQLNLYG